MTTNDKPMERAHKTMQLLASTIPFGLQEQKNVDSEFWVAMVEIARGEKIFLTQMHQDWTTTRQRCKGALFILVFISLMCFGTSSGIVFGLIGLIAVVIFRVTIYQKDRKNRAIYDKDMKAFDWLKTQIPEAQRKSQVGRYEHVLCEDIYQDTRLAIDRVKERLNTVMRVSSFPIWPSGNILPFFPDKEMDAHLFYIEQLEFYFEDYRSIRFPEIPPHVSEEDKEFYGWLQKRTQAR